VSLLVHAALFAAFAVIVPFRVRSAQGFAERETMEVSVSFFTEPAPPAREPEPPPPAPPMQPVVTTPPPAPEPVIVSERSAPIAQMPPAPLPSRPPHSPTPVPVLTVSGAPGAKANS
jgi:hypothetical protein